MMSRKMKFLSAAVGAAALIATVALARAVHTQTASAHQVSGSDGKVIGADPDQNIRSRRHGIVVCDMATNASDCEKMMLPISVNPSNNSSKPPAKI
jgi:hypothetical protein